MFQYKHIREHHTGTNSRIAEQIVEKALERPLYSGEVIHHINGDPAINENWNLVLCEGESYHRLLHTRTKALLSCGNSKYRKCWICQKYDDISNLNITGRTIEHLYCRREYMKSLPIKYICWICKEQDTPENLTVIKGRNQCYHKRCARKYVRNQRVLKHLKGV